MSGYQQAAELAQLPIQDRLDTLEGYVDAFGLDGVLDLLRQICEEKADFAETTWNDRITARSWRKDANSIGKAIRSCRH